MLGTSSWKKFHKKLQKWNILDSFLKKVHMILQKKNVLNVHGDSYY